MRPSVRRTNPVTVPRSKATTAPSGTSVVWATGCQLPVTGTSSADGPGCCACAPSSRRWRNWSAATCGQRAGGGERARSQESTAWRGAPHAAVVWAWPPVPARVRATGGAAGRRTRGRGPGRPVRRPPGRWRCARGPVRPRWPRTAWGGVGRAAVPRSGLLPAVSWRFPFLVGLVLHAGGRAQGAVLEDLRVRDRDPEFRCGLPNGVPAQESQDKNLPVPFR